MSSITAPDWLVIGLAATIAGINFLHFAILLFTTSVAVLVIVSLCSAPPPAARVEEATIGRHADPGITGGSRAGDIALTLLVLGLVAAAWIYFR